MSCLEEAAAARHGTDHELHARLLGRLAISLHFTDAAARRAALCEAALAMARRLGEPGSLGYGLHAAHIATWGPNPRERLSVAEDLLCLASQSGDRVLGYEAHRWRVCEVLELGHRTQLDTELAACRTLAAELRRPDRGR